MKSFHYYLLIGIILLFYSCTTSTDNKLFSIPVDIEEVTSLALSEITENIQPVSLELTDESFINITRIRRVLWNRSYIIVSDFGNIMLFSNYGKFIRRIGKQGSGTGEFTSLISIAADFEKEHLYALAFDKLICFNFDGDVIKETILENSSNIQYINYTNNELLMVGERFEPDENNGFTRYSFVTRMNQDLIITDSTEIRQTHEEKQFFMWNSNDDFISYENNKIYLYYPDLTPGMVSPGPFIRDTLYLYNGKEVVPHLKLDFIDGFDPYTNEGLIIVVNIFRSSRYIFSLYQHVQEDFLYQFCYDLKTGSSYNLENGYTDDIHGIEEIKIRPSSTNLNQFYYLYTHIDRNNIRQAVNPTLYIGTLKK